MGTEPYHSPIRDGCTRLLFEIGDQSFAADVLSPLLPTFIAMVDRGIISAAEILGPPHTARSIAVRLLHNALEEADGQKVIRYAFWLSFTAPGNTVTLADMRSAPGHNIYLARAADDLSRWTACMARSPLPPAPLTPAPLTPEHKGTLH